MNKWLKRFFIVPAFFVGCLLVFAFLINLALPRADSHLTVSDLKYRSKISAFKYVALGDSLTQGVGDTTNQGGFVPILSRQVESDYHYRVTAKNYGVAGNTSQQILTRMKEKTDLQDDLKKSGFIDFDCRRQRCHGCPAQEFSQSDS